MNFFIEKSVDRQKVWMRSFLRAYPYELRIESNASTLYGSNVRFLVAENSLKQQLGFLRLNDKSWAFEEFDQPVWNIADGYVKPPYRREGVLTHLIEYGVKFLNVEMISLHPTAFKQHREYYRRLFFVDFTVGKDSGLVWLFHDRSRHLIAKNQK